MTYKEAALKLCGGYLDMPSGCDGCPLATDEYDGDGNMICALNTVSEPSIVDAVPVVRCRECRRVDGFGGVVIEPDEVGICAVTRMCVNPDDFCSYGKRKED